MYETIEGSDKNGCTMNEDKIRDYIQGRLNSADQILMEENIKNDPKLAALVDEHKNVFLAIHASEQKELKNRFKKIEKVSSRKSLYTKFSIAATIAIVIGVGSMLLFGGPSGPDLFAENFEEYPNVVAPITRGTSPISEDNSHYVAYEKGDYSTAILGFKKSLKQNDDHSVRFYLGMAYLNSGKKDLALKELETIDSKETTFYSQSLWYRALIYLEKENFQKSKELLLKIQEQKTGYNKNKVEKLLNEIQ